MSLFTKLIGTNLKSLKWGHLRTPGDSTVPYITTNINNVNSYVRDRYSNGLKENDLTIRGGQSGAKYASTIDSVRINKFLKDPLKGPFFLYNQVGLQKSNPLIGQSIYINPPDLESKEIAESIRHYSNGGTSTLAQISKTAYGEHIPRHGDIFSYTPGKYEDIMKLQKKGDESESYKKNKLYNYYLNLFNDEEGIATIVDKYKGGPNSVYGLGETKIRRFVYSGNLLEIDKSLIKSRNKINNFPSEYQKYFDYSLSFTDNINIINSRIIPKPSFNFNKSKNIFGIKGLIIQKSEYGIGRKLEKPFSKISNFKPEDQKYTNFSLSSGDDINKVNSRVKPQPSFNLDKKAFGAKGLTIQKSEYAIGSELGNTKPYTEFISPKTNGDTGTKPKNQKKPGTDDLISRGRTAKLYKYNISESISSYVASSESDRSKMANTGMYGRDDSSILSVEFSQINPFSGNINTSQSFSGYINGYSENYSSNWNDIKYNGRAEFLYNFVSYKKTAAFSLQIPIFRVEDLIPTHDKLKELQSGLAGKYSSDSRLGGIITRIKLGHYLRNQYCIINSLNIKIPDEASWDWGILQENYKSAYSTLLDASFNITVIDDKIPTG
jgi:hypothetical protein